MFSITDILCLLLFQEYYIPCIKQVSVSCLLAENAKLILRILKSTIHISWSENFKFHFCQFFLRFLHFYIRHVFNYWHFTVGIAAWKNNTWFQEQFLREGDPRNQAHIIFLSIVAYHRYIPVNLLLLHNRLQTGYECCVN